MTLNVNQILSPWMRAGVTAAGDCGALASMATKNFLYCTISFCLSSPGMCESRKSRSTTPFNYLKFVYLR